MANVGLPAYAVPRPGARPSVRTGLRVASLLLVALAPTVSIAVGGAGLPAKEALEQAVRGTGVWAVYLLVAVLAFGAWCRVREGVVVRDLARLCGRASLVYALAHVGLSLASWGAAFVGEMWARPYVALGAASLVCVLTASWRGSGTSRLVEAAAGLALLHYVWATESAPWAPLATGVALAGLIAFRSTGARKIPSRARRLPALDAPQRQEAAR